MVESIGCLLLILELVSLLEALARNLYFTIGGLHQESSRSSPKDPNTLYPNPNPILTPRAILSLTQKPNLYKQNPPLPKQLLFISFFLSLKLQSLFSLLLPQFSPTNPHLPSNLSSSPQKSLTEDQPRPTCTLRATAETLSLFPYGFLSFPSTFN